MRKHFVGIGEIKISNTPGEVLHVTALGSCVAVVFYSPKDGRTGVAHVALPDSSRNGYKQRTPGYYADTAVSYLIKKFTKNGILKNSQVIINLIGGASIMDPKGTFDIGNRNILAIRKALWFHRLSARNEDVGGDYSRSVKIEPKSGTIIISSPLKGTWTI